VSSRKRRCDSASAETPPSGQRPGLVREDAASLAERNARKSATSLHRVTVERETTRLRRENQQRARDFKKGHGLLDAAARVKYEFVEMNRTCRGNLPSAWRIAEWLLCLAWPTSDGPTCAVEVGVEIRAIHRQYKQRSQDALRADSWRVSCKRVARLMRENGLRSRRAKQHRITTKSNHSLSVVPNYLNRDFTATRPNTKWVSDITFVPTDEGWMYLAVVMDFPSRGMGDAQRLEPRTGDGGVRACCAHAQSRGGSDLPFRPRQSVCKQRFC